MRDDQPTKRDLRSLALLSVVLGLVLSVPGWAFGRTVTVTVEGGNNDQTETADTPAVIELRDGEAIVGLAADEDCETSDVKFKAPDADGTYQIIEDDTNVGTDLTFVTGLTASTPVQLSTTVYGFDKVKFRFATSQTGGCTVDVIIGQ